MESIRKTPAISIDDRRVENGKDILRGSVGAIISLGAALLGLAILHGGITYTRLAGFTFKSLAGWALGLGFTALGAMQAFLCIRGISTEISNIMQRNRWLKKAICARVKIVDRKSEHNDYAETREEEWDCRLAILTPPSMGDAQNGQAAWVSVSRRIYDRYDHQDSAVLLCDPSDPDVFIFEGE